MTGWMEIQVNERLFGEVLKELDRIEPHEHFEGMNECARCDEQVMDAVLRLLKQIPTRETAK